MTQSRNRKSNQTMLLSILLFWATGWFSACSESNGQVPDTIEPTDQVPILLGADIDKSKQQTAGSRAVNLEEKTTTFKVYGYKNTAYDSATDSYSGLQTVFGGYTVTYTAGSAGSTVSNAKDWEYVNGTTQTIHYWDYSATVYRFGAFAPATADVTATATATSLTLSMPVDATSDASIAATPYYARMWFSDNSMAYSAYGSPVMLTFVQPLSRVRIRFIDAEGNEVKTSSLVFEKTTAGSIAFKPTDSTQKIVLKGSVAASYPLTGSDKAETVTATPTTETGSALDAITEPYETVAAFASVTEKWYTVLPQGTQGSYTMTMTYNGMPRTAVVPAEYMSWKPGYGYTYVFGSPTKL